MRRILVIGLSLFYATAGMSLQFSPQDIFPTEKRTTAFTLEVYIQAYLDNSPRLKAEINTLKKSHNTYKNAFTAAYLPTFSLGAEADKTYGRTEKPSSWPEFRRADSSAYATGTWNLFNSGKDMLGYKSASLDYQMAQISFDSGLQQHVLDAVQVYYDLLLSEKLLKVYQDDLTIAHKQYEQDKVLYDNGLKTRSDLLSSETSWRSSQLSLFSAQNDYANALKNFNISLNRPLETPVQLEENTSLHLPELPSLDADLTQALAHRYDARIRRLSLKQADLSKTIDSLNTLPNAYVNLFANTARGFNHHELWDYNYGISAGLSFDIGFFYLNKYRERKNIQITNQNDHLEYEQFLRSLRDAVVEARNALLLKMRSMEISDLRLKAATQKFEATQQKYKNGLMSATDLTVARQEMISAQVGFATLQSELLLTRLKYRYALGEKIYDYTPEDL